MVRRQMLQLQSSVSMGRVSDSRREAGSEMAPQRHCRCDAVGVPDMAEAWEVERKGE